MEIRGNTFGIISESWNYKKKCYESKRSLMMKNLGSMFFANSAFDENFMLISFLIQSNYIQYLQNLSFNAQILIPRKFENLWINLLINW